METLSDAIDKKLSKSLFLFKGLVDPKNTFRFDTQLVSTWNRLALNEQRRLYLYCLYKKWRGEPFYGTPYEIVKNCHPYPTNWNGRPLINRLIKETPMVRAKYDGSYGIYTRDEARVWEMTDIEPLNYKP